MLFEFFNSGGPEWRDGLCGVGDRVEAGHNNASDAFNLSGFGFNHALFHSDASRADVCYLCPYIDIFAEESRSEEVDVHVCDNKVEVVHVDFMTDYRREVVYFGEIHEHEIDIVVEVPEHVDVGEPNLHGNAVAEGECGVDNAWIVGMEE